MFRVCAIDCHQQEKGFRHSVYQSTKVNGKLGIELVDTNFISEILDEDLVKEYTKDPVGFFNDVNNV